ncbi:NAD(P)/FAD-dependent oxidoreductase [Pseudophaeobacter sp.]|uniref:flavin monoamine oxidase family protein n=1 Tax=Pseudophaeobacter sp. TaxID=1971739 RepID=UPI0032970928
MKTGIAIIGGGLSGLALARHLDRAGQDYQLFEARDRLGGRAHSLEYGNAGFDLGPSWFWPGQERMTKLVQELDLERFDQYASGALSYETDTGEVVRNAGYASMQGSWRLKEGMQGLIKRLAAQLPAARLHLGQALLEVAQDGGLRFSSGQQWQAQKVILALPPRLAAELCFSPPLPPDQLDALRAIPTWMGGQAKFLALYDAPFWRKTGLSGDAMSQAGPLAEIHDASAPDVEINPEATAALFGFVGLPVKARQGKDSAIEETALAQLVRIFGPEAAQPVRTAYLDWAQEEHSSAPLDQQPPRQHPTYGLPPSLRGIWDGRLALCVSETAPEMGGYLEGALAAAEDMAREIAKQFYKDQG